MRAGCLTVADRERMLFILNAPADGDIEEPLRTRRPGNVSIRHWTHLSASGLDDRPGARWRCVPTTPEQFHRLFPATGGALYGRASHGWTASFQRPGSRTRIPGLYLAAAAPIRVRACRWRRFRHAGGGEPGRGPRFDADVPPAAYLWWYVDGLSDCGRYGLSVIAFVGSVFSPYYHWAGRRDPDDHVCINVALYRPAATAGA
jgi:hypothetical protein